MKNLILLILIVISNLVFSQNCRPGLYRQDLEYGEYENVLSTGGDLFIGNNSHVGVNLENGKLASLLCAGGLFVGGKFGQKDFRLAGVKYRTASDGFDYYPGPLDAKGESNENNCKNWDYIFEVSKNDIKKAIGIVYGNKTTPNVNVKCSEIPINIRNWPARGNPYFEEISGFDLPDQELASFFDFDLDGKYDPCKGDLPSLSSSNCDYKTALEVLSSFPTQLYFNIINDNGGVHKFSAGKALKVEIHSYFFTFQNEEGEDLSYYKYKTINKGEVPIDSFYFALWVDPGLGCYMDDYVGTSKDNDLLFVYNIDAVDGNQDTICDGLAPTFGKKIPMVGLSFIEGIKDEIGKDKGLTGSYFHNANFNFDPLCDTVLSNGCLLNLFTTDEFVYEGNPSNPLDLMTMCARKSNYSVRNAYMISGGVKLLPTQSQEVIIAMTVAKNVPHPCPDSKYIIDVNNRAKKLYENCWKTFEGPDAPNVIASGNDGVITLKLNNKSIGHNNKDLKYEEVIDGVIASNNKYLFEGYKIYQLDKSDYNLNRLGDKNSYEIMTMDLKNGVEEIYNWETIILENGQRKLVKTLKAKGENKGINNEIKIDFDYIANEEIKVNKEYHYVVIAYGYNNYEDYNETSNTGQARQYITSLSNAKIISISPKYVNKEFAGKVKRISGRGTYNNLEISKETREKMFSPSFDGFIDYLPNYGPFDLKILDTTKIKGKTFRIEIDGPIDESVKVCAFKLDETYFNVSDIATGETYRSNNPISKSFDEKFDDFGIQISVFQPVEPNVETGFLGEKLSYEDKNGPFWFSAVKDKPYQFNGYHDVLDPFYFGEDKFGEVSQITSGNFVPFYYSRYTSQVNFPYITPTSIEAMPIVIDIASGTLKEKDLNNVDIVFTSDKSKWSRCIVVETASSFLSNLGTTDNKFLEVKENNSVDKDGNIEPVSKGFSWFPGYAVDVETGDRLNIFFGENTALSKNEKSLRNPTIANDMLFNPSDEMVSESNFEEMDSFLLKYPVGGGHYIYVTRQVYDECEQLATKLKKGTSAFSKREPLGAITWTSIPVLPKGFGLLPYNQGVIPKNMTVSLRVNNTFFRKNDLTDIFKFRNCIFDSKNPVYEISFEKVSNILNVPSDTRWFYNKNFSGFSVNSLNDKIVIEVSDINGNIIDNKSLDYNQILEWKASDFDIKKTILFVKITSLENGTSKGYKTIIME